VTHRLSGPDAADELVVLDRGRIVQRGTHQALAAASGPYRRLLQAQRGDLVETASSDRRTASAAGLDA